MRSNYTNIWIVKSYCTSICHFSKLCINTSFMKNYQDLFLLTERNTRRISIFKNDSFIYLRERERESKQGKRGREKERKISSRLPPEYGAIQGCISDFRTLRSWPEFKSQRLNWLRPPSSQGFLLLWKKVEGKIGFSVCFILSHFRGNMLPEQGEWLHQVPSLRTTLSISTSSHHKLWIVYMSICALSWYILCIC